MPYKDIGKQKEASHNWYVKNKQQVLDSNRRNRIELKKWFNDYKENNPCCDCGLYYPYYVMQFDHLRDKICSVSKLATYSISVAKREMDKCELVCANCHAIRTQARLVGVMESTKSF